MSDEVGGRGSLTVVNGGQPRSLDELWALRTDYRDVPVDALGGTDLRIYALTGTARARLLGDMADLANERDVTDPATVHRVFMFQVRVVAASMGYPEAQWDDLGSTLGAATIEQLYVVAAELSGLDQEQQQAATERLPRRRSAASGTA